MERFFYGSVCELMSNSHLSGAYFFAISHFKDVDALIEISDIKRILIGRYSSGTIDDIHRFSSEVNSSMLTALLSANKSSTFSWSLAGLGYTAMLSWL